MGHSHIWDRFRTDPCVRLDECTEEEEDHQHALTGGVEHVPVDVDSSPDADVRLDCVDWMKNYIAYYTNHSLYNPEDTGQSFFLP
mmetsp:Transcript_7546/g.9600  ORF Transcript_7546/g.9600 Transcript_7546/m.9600 type:complete len:85 (-) Transcript_7546:511-765(-)